MDGATIKAMLKQHFEYASSDPEHAHAMYTEDAVLEFPQSGERFAGVENLSEWRSNYPANFGVSIIELRADKIARESIYVTEGFAPPEWRAKWRAAP